MRKTSRQTVKLIGWSLIYSAGLDANELNMNYYTQVNSIKDSRKEASKLKLSEWAVLIKLQARGDSFAPINHQHKEQIEWMMHLI